MWGLRADNYEYRNIFGGFLHFTANWLQIDSFRYGFSTDLNKIDTDKAVKDRFGGIIGASVGWNFFVNDKFDLKHFIRIPFTHEYMGFGAGLNISI